MYSYFTNCVSNIYIFVESTIETCYHCFGINNEKKPLEKLKID